MKVGIIEERLARYDDRFEITGQIFLNTGKDQAELSRVLFAWTLFNREDPTSIDDLVLLLEGTAEEVSKVLRSAGKDPITGRTGTILLKMHKELVKEVKAWASKEDTENIPSFLMGKGALDRVFDLSNYDLIATETSLV